MIYFISDTHFCHSNIINLCDRPFKSTSHMNDTLIHNWNAYVTDHDEIYILGDFYTRVVVRMPIKYYAV